jgi:hypothetical protein
METKRNSDHSWRGELTVVRLNVSREANRPILCILSFRPTTDVLPHKCRFQSLARIVNLFYNE